VIADTHWANGFAAVGTVGAVVLALSLMPIDRYRRKREAWDETRRLLIMAAADPSSPISTELAATLVNAITHQTRIASDELIGEIQSTALVQPRFADPNRRGEFIVIERQVAPLVTMRERLTSLEETHWWEWRKRRDLLAAWAESGSTQSA